MSSDIYDESLSVTLPLQITSRVNKKVPPELQPENPDLSARGKIVVITGGGTGIGAAAARVWARAGAEGVIITGRTQRTLEAATESIRKLACDKTRVYMMVADVKSEVDMRMVFSSVVAEFGRPADVVIANAGWTPTFKKPHEEDVKTWWSVYETNVLGVHNTIVSFIRSQSDPGRPVGTIIAVSSGVIGFKLPGASAYATSKLAAHRYVEAVSNDYSTLRVFTLLPGLVDTPLVQSANPENLSRATDDPELTGAMALYLSTPKADYLHGSLMSVNWDIQELERYKSEIESGALKTSWIPVLPVCGGSGLGRKHLSASDSTLLTPVPNMNKEESVHRRNQPSATRRNVMGLLRILKCSS